MRMVCPAGVRLPGVLIRAALLPRKRKIPIEHRTPSDESEGYQTSDASVTLKVARLNVLCCSRASDRSKIADSRA
jgi:hypothetical protein